MGQTPYTIFVFRIPFMIPIPDGSYEVKLGNRFALISTKRFWSKEVAGWSGSGGRIELMFDKYGMSGYTNVEIRFPWKMSERELGRQVALFRDPHVSVPRNKNKETAIRFLNRLVEVVRVVYDQFHLENVRYSDVLSYEQHYWDGQKMTPTAKHMFDHGMGGIKLSVGKMSTEQVKKEKGTLQRFRNILKNDIPIATERLFLANAKDACLQEDYRIATIEAVTALEITLYRFIRSRCKEMETQKESLEDFIVRVGLKGHLKIVLKMLTHGLEQPEEEVVDWCSGAIKIRNDILHRGLRDVPPTETEHRIKNIEKMIDYLTRISVGRRE